MPEKIALYRRSDSKINLADAAKELPQNSIGLFYTPMRCAFGMWNGTALLDHQEVGIDLSQIFEARLFNPELELHWLRDCEGSGEGRAVYLTENAERKWEPVSIRSAREHDYLLWGRGWVGTEKLAEGWSCLAEARIGTLYVPIPNIDQDRCVQLKACEYFGLASGEAGKEHGNTVVLAERLLGLKISEASGRAA